MVSRTLRVGVWGVSPLADSAIAALNQAISQHESRLPEGAGLRVVALDGESEVAAASHHLVCGIGVPAGRWTDVSLESTAEIEPLVHDRLIPWIIDWSNGKRAPRAQIAKLAEPDPGWANTAQRLIARVRSATDGVHPIRIDHIGSTSVEGLPAKNLIDLQVIMGDDDQLLAAAEAITDAGFVRVDGEGS